MFIIYLEVTSLKKKIYVIKIMKIKAVKLSTAESTVSFQTRHIWEQVHVSAS